MTRIDRLRRWLFRPADGEVGASTGTTIPPGGDPAVQATIDRILDEVRDPESGLPISELGLVRRVRVASAHQIIYLDVPFDNHTPGCLTCAGIAMTIIAGIRRELTRAFEDAFPGYHVEFL